MIADHNRFTRFPDEIENLSIIHSISVQDNVIRMIPKEIGKLTRCRSLIASDNYIGSDAPNIECDNVTLPTNTMAIPEDIFSMRALTELNLERNDLKTWDFPQKLPNSLLDLKLGQNRNLKNIPRCVLASRSLQNLMMDDCAISTSLDKYSESRVPGDIDFSTMLSLKTLSLKGNQLTAIPKSLASLNQLDLLNLESNPIGHGFGAVATMDTLKQLMDLTTAETNSHGSDVKREQIQSINVALTPFAGQEGHESYPNHDDTKEQVIDVIEKLNARQARYDVKRCGGLGGNIKAFDQLFGVFTYQLNRVMQEQPHMAREIQMIYECQAFAPKGKIPEHIMTLDLKNGWGWAEYGRHSGGQIPDTVFIMTTDTLKLISTAELDPIQGYMEEKITIGKNVDAPMKLHTFMNAANDAMSTSEEISKAMFKEEVLDWKVFQEKHKDQYPKIIKGDVKHTGSDANARDHISESVVPTDGGDEDPKRKKKKKKKNDEWRYFSVSVHRSSGHDIAIDPLPDCMIGLPLPPPAIEQATQSKSKLEIRNASAEARRQLANKAWCVPTDKIPPSIYESIKQTGFKRLKLSSKATLKQWLESITSAAVQQEKEDCLVRHADFEADVEEKLKVLNARITTLEKGATEADEKCKRNEGKIPALALGNMKYAKGLVDMELAQEKKNLKTKADAFAVQRNLLENDGVLAGDWKQTVPAEMAAFDVDSDLLTAIGNAVGFNDEVQGVKERLEAHHLNREKMVKMSQKVGYM